MSDQKMQTRFDAVDWLIQQQAAFDVGGASKDRRPSQAADELSGLRIHKELLRHPFRNADKKDWDWLMERLGDGGHGKFWKEVMTEALGALELTK